MIQSIVLNESGAELLYEEMPGKTKGSMIICAGGAYMWLSPREEWPVAGEFTKAGYQCYILKYSVGMNEAPLGKKPVKQLAESVAKVKEIAKEKGNPIFTAVCGFSAGGHLAASLGVHWNDGSLLHTPESKDGEHAGDGIDICADLKFSEEGEADPEGKSNVKEIPNAEGKPGVEGEPGAERSLNSERRLNAEMIRPDALVLSYAAVDLHDFDGQEFVQCLCGTDKDVYEYFQISHHISKDVPPTFLWHTVPDEEVSVRSSMKLAEGLIRNGVFSELHIFPEGVHGMSLATPDVNDPKKNRVADKHLARWTGLCIEWLEIVERKNKILS